MPRRFALRYQEADARGPQESAKGSHCRSAGFEHLNLQCCNDCETHGRPKWGARRRSLERAPIDVDGPPPSPESPARLHPLGARAAPGRLNLLPRCAQLRLNGLASTRQPRSRSKRCLFSVALAAPLTRCLQPSDSKRSRESRKCRAGEMTMSSGSKKEDGRQMRQEEVARGAS